MSKKWLVAMSLSIFLLTGLSTSSFFLTDFLTQAIENDEHTNRQLNFAINQNNEAAILYAIKKSKQGSDTWQTLAKKLAKKNGEYAYLLAEFYLANVSERENSSDNLNKVKFWYQQAIRLNYSKASISLAKLNFQEGNILMAQNILNEFQVMDIHQPQQNDDMISAIILTLKIAINIGNTDLVNKLLGKYSSLLQVNKQGSQLLSLIAKYRILPITDDQNNVSVQSSSTCANSIQFFATSLANLTKLDKLVSHLKNNSLSPFVCYTPIRYLPISSLSCISEQEHPIECNESKLYGVAESINTRYAAIMLPKGGANVHFGILYFDEHDSVDVLEHEISHLLGFVDEYPLSKGHVTCRAIQKNMFSQNIAVLNKRYKGQQDVIRQNILKQLPWAKQIKETTPILQLNNTGSDSDNKQYWALGTPESFEQEVGLFKAQTCDNNTVKQKLVFGAFKPLISRTKLQYNELNLPKDYISLLAVNKDKFLMPSFHYNIALAYYQQNNPRLASKWLEKSIKLESNEYRREKVRQGDF